MQKPHAIGALGGTFDHFHSGHQRFLAYASERAEHLIIGVTKPELTQPKEFSWLIQDIDVRIQAVQRFCQDHIDSTFEIVELEDSFGPTLGQRKIDCLIVTELTVEGGRLVNTLRTKRGLQKLPTYVCEMVLDNDKHILNSTNIRAGKVSREGVVYKKLLEKDITISDSQRQILKKPFGEIVQQPSKAVLPTYIAVVGDTCLANFIANNWQYHLGIYDLKEKRKESNLMRNIVPHQRLTNPSGMITSRVAEYLMKVIAFDVSSRKKVYVQIDGEEDLLVIPLILLLPLSSKIYYGQPNVGMVEVVVTETLKSQLATLLVQ